MKKIMLLLLLPLMVGSCKNSSEEKKELQTAESQEENATTKAEYTGPPTIYYLIRHAEKDRTNPNTQDPSLNINGLKRAQGWAKYFTSIQLDEVYATPYIRTKQTVSILAQEKAITIKTYNPANTYTEEFLNQTRGKHILIVGHSNTIPKLVNFLIGEDKYEDMDDTDNSTLYKVTLSGDEKKVEVITVD